MSNKLPKISIITVCYNSEKTIEKTLESVKNQSYTNIEHIIIDGVSKDNTLEIVKRFPHVTAVYSEPDKGIYDAMNKGIARATGDYLWFLHSDDQIYANDTLELAMLPHQNEDFIYGRALLVNEQGVERSLEERKAHPNAATLSWKTMKNGMVICHQSMLVKRSITPLYNLNYSIAGDLEWAICLLKKVTTVRDTNLYLCRFFEGGASTKHRKIALKQRFEILTNHFGLLPTLWQHLLITIRALRRGTIR